MQQEENRELDALLSECKELLGEQERPSSTTTAEDVHIDYKQFYGEDIPEADLPASVRPLTAYEQSKPAYQTAKRSQAAKSGLQPEEPAAEPKAESAPSADSEQFADWLFEQGTDEQTEAQRQAAQSAFEQLTQPAPERPKKKKKGILRIACVIAAIVLALCILSRQPMDRSTDRTRVPNTSTILLAGTDEGGLRTDTMILMRISGKEHKINLVSVPRDTLVLGDYAVPKINSAYGYAGGEKDGMEELLKRIEETVGFRPDGYMLIRLEGFEKLVDAMGGVRYDVPMPMQYSDPTQDLQINLQAGEQTLTGEQAMQLVRFRSGYAAADLERVSVQRKFLTEAIKQWTSPLRIFRYPAALAVLTRYVESDLSFGNYFWICTTAPACAKNVETQTLPGYPMTINGGSYYVLDGSAVVETVNGALNPYEEEIGLSDLTIRNG